MNGDTEFAQIVAATTRAFGDEGFDRAFSNAETSGNFFLRETLDFSEEEHFAAAGRQGVNRLSEQSQLLLVTHKLHNIRLILQDGRTGRFHDGHMVNDCTMADEISDGITRDGEKQRLPRPQICRFSHPQNSRVGILHDVVDIAGGG